MFVHLAQSFRGQIQFWKIPMEVSQDVCKKWLAIPRLPVYKTNKLKQYLKKNCNYSAHKTIILTKKLIQM